MYWLLQALVKISPVPEHGVAGATLTDLPIEPSAPNPPRAPSLPSPKAKADEVAITTKAIAKRMRVMCM